MRDLGWSDFLWTTTDFSRMYHWVSVRFASISQLRNSKHSLFLSELVKTWKGLDPLKTEKTQNLLGAPPEGFSWRAITPVSQFSIDPLPGLWGQWCCLVQQTGSAVGILSSVLTRAFALLEPFWGDRKRFWRCQAKWSLLPLVPCWGRDEIWLLDLALGKSSLLQIEGEACSLTSQMERTMVVEGNVSADLGSGCYKI